MVNARGTDSIAGRLASRPVRPLRVPLLQRSALDVGRVRQRRALRRPRRTGGLAAGLVATTGGPEAARPGFRAVRALTDHLGLAMCSMGMTDDLEVAVQEGSTQVRVGSALFGERPYSAAAVR